MRTFALYRVRFTQCRGYRMMVRAPTPDFAQAFAEQIRLEIGTAPFEALGQPFGSDWKTDDVAASEEAQPDLLRVVEVAIDQLRRGTPRWIIEGKLSDAFDRAKAPGCAP